jgi:hypothetical protein
MKLEIIKSKCINLEEPVLLVSREQAFYNFIEAIDKFCPNLKVEDISKKDWEKLFYSYGDCIINYHPENYHQERATLLANSENLKKYGLTNEEISYLDFT